MKLGEKWGLAIPENLDSGLRATAEGAADEM